MTKRPGQSISKPLSGPRFGAHVSAAGSVADAPLRANEIGCECFQFFSRSPRGGPAPKLDRETVARFRNRCTEYNLPALIHAPYYINFASAKIAIRAASARVLREELERGSLLGCRAMMAHLGSARDVGLHQALELTVDGIVTLLRGYQGSTQFLIEISAGAGEVIGDSFEEIATIIHQAEKRIPQRIGVCFDTCHAFASGYDLRTPKTVSTTLDSFASTLGMDRLIALHLNDALAELNSRKDRHEHIGFGQIGRKGFAALVRDKRLEGLPAILETPADSRRLNDLRTLKRLRATQ